MFRVGLSDDEAPSTLCVDTVCSCSSFFARSETVGNSSGPTLLRGIQGSAAMASAVASATEMREPDFIIWLELLTPLFTTMPLFMSLILDIWDIGIVDPFIFTPPDMRCLLFVAFADVLVGETPALGIRVL